MFKHLPRFEFGVVQPKIESLITATANKIEREWPARLAHCRQAEVLLSSFVRVAGNTYRTTLFFCADKPENFARKEEYVVSAPPLTRTILDTLFTVVFMLEDIEKRSTWFYKSGWREIVEDLERIKARYGDHELWKTWIAQKETFVDSTRRSWRIDAEEAVDLKLIKYWPNPGQMLARHKLEKSSKAYLQYLNDWLYKHLSSASHLSWPGLAGRAHFFLRNGHDDETREQLLEKYRSDQVTICSVVILSLLSEIELSMQFGLRERLAFVWRFFREYADDAKVVYDLRYGGLSFMDTSVTLGQTAELNSEPDIEVISNCE